MTIKVLIGPRKQVMILKELLKQSFETFVHRFALWGSSAGRPPRRENLILPGDSGTIGRPTSSRKRRDNVIHLEEGDRVRSGESSKEPSLRLPLSLYPTPILDTGANFRLSNQTRLIDKEGWNVFQNSVGFPLVNEKSSFTFCDRAMRDSISRVWKSKSLTSLKNEYSSSLPLISRSVRMSFSSSLRDSEKSFENNHHLILSQGCERRRMIPVSGKVLGSRTSSVLLGLTCVSSKDFASSFPSRNVLSLFLSCFMLHLPDHRISRGRRILPPFPGTPG